MSLQAVSSNVQEKMIVMVPKKLEATPLDIKQIEATQIQIKENEKA
jgi:hypothetical protein